MIEHMLHFIGLCPDSLAHFDLLDFIAYNWTTVTDTVSYYYKKVKVAN